MKPPFPLTDRRFNYVPASNTDVQSTWRKHGWAPKSEQVAQPKPLRVVKKGAA